MEEILLMAANWIAEMVVKYPQIGVVIAIVGTLRLIVKPFMSFAHEYVIVTESKKDDELLAKVESSKFYKFFLYFIDWFGSIKVKK